MGDYTSLLEGIEELVALEVEGKPLPLGHAEDDGYGGFRLKQDDYEQVFVAIGENGSLSLKRKLASDDTPVDRCSFLLVSGEYGHSALDMDRLREGLEPNGELAELLDVVIRGSGTTKNAKKALQQLAQAFCVGGQYGREEDVYTAQDWFFDEDYDEIDEESNRERVADYGITRTSTDGEIAEAAKAMKKDLLRDAAYLVGDIAGCIRKIAESTPEEWMSKYQVSFKKGEAEHG